MPKLDELPVELLAHVALFANKLVRDYNPNIALRELLALRCASRSCKDAVSRAARQHKAVESLSFHGSSAQKIAVIYSDHAATTTGTSSSDATRSGLAAS